MKTGGRWLSWRSWVAALFALGPMLACAPGCAKDRASVGRNLMSQHNAPFDGDLASCYRAGCPDIIDVKAPDRPEFDGRYEIGPDGRIELGDYGRLRIEGRTPAEMVNIFAAETGVNRETLALRVVEYRSQRLILFGEVIGEQRTVAYCGPETVLELLQRVGGITPGAEPRDVYVVRPHLGENRRPEVFHVDLRAIVLKHHHKSNIRLLPYDQIYVGETRRAQIEKAIPPWMRGAYRTIWKSPALKDRQEAPGE